MDYHLSTLFNTLSTIHSLQEQLLNNGRPQPFTNAFLASQQPDSFNKAVDQFIRDTSPLERRLFHFPPVGGIFDDGSSKDGQHGGNAGGGGGGSGAKRDVEEEAADIAAETIPRKPEVRNVSVPTPLRSTTVRSGSGGVGSIGGARSVAATSAASSSSDGLMSQYDARALLVAAQRLNENYQRLPRNRKHIRVLLKKHNESSGQVETNNARAAKIEEMMARLANGDDVSTLEELPALLNNAADGGGGGEKVKAEEEKRKKQSRKLKELREKAQRIKDELNREEMEVLALEEMREELLQQKRALQGQRATAGGSAGGAPSTSSTAARKLAGVVPPVARGIPRAGTGAGSSTSTSSRQAPTTGKHSEAVAKVFSTGTKERGSISPAEDLKKKKVTPPTVTPPKMPSSRASLGAMRKAGSGTASSSSPSKSSPLASRDTDDDVTVRLKPDEIAAAKAAGASPSARGVGAAATPLDPTPSRSSALKQSAMTSTTRDPEATDELERLTEKIWDTFGDHLRFSNPSLEAADFITTLDLLRQSIAQRSTDDVNSTDPTGSSSSIRKDDGSSIISSSEDAISTSTSTSSSLPTTSTSSSSQSTTGTMGPGGNVASPTLQSRLSSLILLELLLSPPPEHSIDFPTLKVKGKQWYESLGQVDRRSFSTSDFTGQEGAAATAAGGGGGASSEASTEEDGEGLTTKAVYALVAKRLLRVRRAGGRARVGFS